ncbi:MAG: hypothetical protein ABI671_12095 [Burkholderiales bacterium]
MKKAIVWAVFVGACFGLYRLASAIGNPWAAANVMAPAEAQRVRAEALRIPGCADHPEVCK